MFALRENGFRSNGLSSVRKAFAQHFNSQGSAWWVDPRAPEYIKAAAEPSVLYDKLLARANGWYDRKFKAPLKIKAIAHISGGGIPGKFAEDILFPLGLSAQLYELWEPPLVMKKCLIWHGEMTEKEAYQTWNGGQGMLVVVDRRDRAAFSRLAKAHGIEAREAGDIFTSPDPRLVIKSGYSGDLLTYRPKTRR